MGPRRIVILIGYLHQRCGTGDRLAAVKRPDRRSDHEVETCETPNVANNEGRPAPGESDRRRVKPSERRLHADAIPRRKRPHRTSTGRWIGSAQRGHPDDARHLLRRVVEHV